MKKEKRSTSANDRKGSSKNLRQMKADDAKKLKGGATCTPVKIITGQCKPIA